MFKYLNTLKILDINAAIGTEGQTNEDPNGGREVDLEAEKWLIKIKIKIESHFTQCTHFLWKLGL